MLRPALAQLKNRHDLVGAEIGVFHGNYALIYLKELDIKKVFLIDPYEKYENYDRYRPEALAEAERGAHIKLGVYEDRIEWVREKSWNAASRFDDESLDFVYIDGNHTYPAVIQDITLYYPKIKKGGLLSGHDYRPPVPGHVFDATEEFCKKNNLKIYVDGYDWWVWK